MDGAVAGVAWTTGELARPSLSTPGLALGQTRK
jgi:hypothetical protein